jgi:26S proteasome regulatory subunit N10
MSHLEATVICIDNSEWMRNGDFSPSRFEAQQDACVSICGTKGRQHPENSVGLISCAGKAVEVCAPLTQDPGKVIAAFHKVKICGDSNFVGAIRVAQLALRHRQ